MPNIERIKTDLLIIGSGIAGCLAASFFRSREPVIVTQSPSIELSTNRRLFRVSDERIPLLLGCPSRHIDVESTVWSLNTGFTDKPTVKQRNEYSIKTAGRITKRSISDVGTKKRIILDGAPSPAIPKECTKTGYGLLSIENRVAYFSNYIGSDANIIEVEYRNAISTIPMPALLIALGYSELSQAMCEANLGSWSPREISISNLRVTVPVDASQHQTIYFPDSFMSVYRASLMGSLLSIERMKDYEPINRLYFDEEDAIIANLFGLACSDCEQQERYTIKNGKITSLDSATKKKIMFTVTANEGIWSLGRFATWTNIKTDDLMKDLETISKMIEANGSKNFYDLSKMQ